MSDNKVIRLGKAPARKPAALVRLQVVARLRDAITEGEYLPGDKLTERELCGRFGASRPSVREALRQLEAEGLLEIAPHRGPTVRTLDLAQFGELHELRVALEALAARRFALHGTIAEMDAFAACINAFDKALGARNVARIRVAKHALYEGFIAGAHNEPLASFIRNVNARLGFLWSSSLQHPGRREESVDEYRRLLLAIRERDADAAHAAVVLHNQRARAIGLHTLEQLTRSAAQGRA
ncbi:MAG TPA: GntR family transcriptional regulator [Burkholderiales bacterium]